VLCGLYRLVSGAAYMSLCWVRRRPRVCVEGSRGGAARVRTAFPTCAVYNAPQDGGYLMLDVVPMMLRALGVMCVSVWRVFAARRLNKSSQVKSSC